jgi:multidrug transporter EmrE-like cation transporter
MSTPVIPIAFLVMQVSANLIFKYGSSAPSRWLICFIVGNIIGASSIFFMMKLYERLNVNIAMAIGGGGTFLLAQLALAVVFHSRLAPLQWAGIAMVGVGMGLATMSVTGVRH